MENGGPSINRIRGFASNTKGHLIQPSMERDQDLKHVLGPFLSTGTPLSNQHHNTLTHFFVEMLNFLAGSHIRVGWHDTQTCSQYLVLDVSVLGSAYKEAVELAESNASMFLALESQDRSAMVPAWGLAGP